MRYTGLRNICIIHLTSDTRGASPYACKIHDFQEIQLINTCIQSNIAHRIENPLLRTREHIHIFIINSGLISLNID